MHMGVRGSLARRVGAVMAVVAATAAFAAACASPGLGAPASISGRVIIPDDVVLTEDTHIEVYLRHPGENGSDRTFASAPIGADGSYTIAPVPADDYTLHVTVYDADLAPQWWGGATNARDADVFHLDSGERRTGMGVELVKGSTLAGTISMPTGSKQSPEHVWVTVWDSEERLWIGDSAVSPDGEYAVRGLAAGEYKIEVTPANSTAARQWWKGASQWPDAEIVTVGASTVRDGLDVSLTAGGTISGVVRREAAKEYGASVYSSLLAADGEWEQGSWAEAEQDGTYRIRGVAPGRYVVMFSRPIRDRPWGDAATAMRSQSSEAEPSHEKYWDDKPDRESADLLVVGEGDELAGISADLDAPPPSAP